MEGKFLRLAILGLFVGSGAAKPIFGFGDKGPEGKEFTDQALLEKFELMGQYAGAAYCENNHNSVGDKITCEAGICDLVEAAETTTVAEFEDFPGTDVTGYVAVDDTNKMVVVAFRGSNSVENWITNLDFPPTDTDLCEGCTAHSGFWNSWLDARETVMAAIKNASAANPDYELVTTGHSLGGAIATLAAANLRVDGETVALYSYGAPRVAPEILSEFITNQPGGNFRITHDNDIVPRLPPRLLTYVHISPEFFIDEQDSDEAVELGNIEILEGTVNKNGNGGKIFTSVLAHLQYFNKITACAIDQIAEDVGIDLDFD